MISIVELACYPEHAPVLARWAYDEWYKTRSIKPDLLVRSYSMRKHPGELPLSLVALNESEPVGMVSLKMNELWKNPENPWLTSLYVIPDFRGKKIGEALVRALNQKAGALGFRELYLFFESEKMNLKSYYERTGFVFHSSATGNENNPVFIMKISIPSRNH